MIDEVELQQAIEKIRATFPTAQQLAAMYEAFFKSIAVDLPTIHAATQTIRAELPADPKQQARERIRASFSTAQQLKAALDTFFEAVSSELPSIRAAIESINAELSIDPKQQARERSRADVAKKRQQMRRNDPHRPGGGRR